MQDDPYGITVKGIRLDPYLIAELFELTPAAAQALKKLLRCGRKHKSRETDLREAAETIERQIEIDQLMKEWKSQST